ncbi:amino acid ABC transporter substrate-binding protein [Actinoplanes sp. KI2]|uniref:amino acid ABC transporter substrate-binding protein n=1 Tax=Actinoplanes sp. KI2 TaxID=2983315 RepID=UPI0021D5D274|nr:amino acid ABC transporter substrate-binding protein [Actinoplanes sp. KI2]MCU7729902.1 amino acid ABC transporter substrate-binding protein [Actinoplanes sp. KI2]
MRSGSAVLASTVACSLALAACGSKGEAPSGGSSGGDTLVIGASLSLTGALAREGKLTQEGYQLCQDRVNAAGGVPVGGKKLKLAIQFQDDTSKPDTAAQLVDQFNDKGVKLILASYGSANTEAQAAVIERNGQVMVDSAGADNKIFSKGYKRTFAVLSPATEYASSIVKSIAELAQPKPKTVVFLSADDGFSKTVTEGGMKTAQEQGFTVQSPQYFKSGTSDVSSSLIKVKGQRPDVIIGSVHLVEGIAIVKQAKELGVVPAGGFGETVAPPTPDFAKTLGPQAENVLGSSQWTPSTKGEDKYFGNAQQYSADIKAKFGHDAEYHDAEASAACLALTLAAEAAGDTSPDKVRDALAGLDTTSFFGKIKFDATGQNVYKPMSVIQIQQGRAVTVWPADAAQAKLVWPGTTP